MYKMESKPSHVFLFGNKDAKKGQMLSLTQDNSFINQVVAARDIQSVRVSLLCLGEDHLL